MTTLVGADISIRMVEYARDLAAQQQVSDRVEFHVMDALRMIEFPKGYFDLVNQRMGVGYLRTWDWPGLIQKYQWVTRPGGVIRITEGEILGNTNSPAVNQLSEIACDAFFHAGHTFAKGHQGITHKLGEILHQQGIQNVQTRRILIDYTAPEMMDMGKENIRILFRTIVPFLQKWSQVPKNYDQIYQQALEEMNQPNFTSEWQMATAWGTNPHQQQKPLTIEHH